MGTPGNLSTNIVVPKSPSDGGVGGNPYVYLVLHDGKGKDLTEEHFLGRCVEGLNVSADLITDGMVNAKFASAGCKNPRGSYLTAEIERDITLVLDGTRVRIGKKVLNNKLGPNPLISLQMLHDDGTPMGAPIVLGRCSNL